MEDIFGGMQGRGHGSRGFTLLEIIVALALIATAVVVVMQLFSANLRAITSSEGYVDASAHAEAVMRTVLTDEDFPENAVSSGTLGIYRYETSATKVNEERYSAANADLYLVKVALRWKDGSRDRSVSLDTLKLVQRKI